MMSFWLLHFKLIMCPVFWFDISWLVTNFLTMNTTVVLCQRFCVPVYAHNVCVYVFVWVICSTDHRWVFIFFQHLLFSRRVFPFFLDGKLIHDSLSHHHFARSAELDGHPEGECFSAVFLREEEVKGLNQFCSPDFMWAISSLKWGSEKTACYGRVERVKDESQPAVQTPLSASFLLNCIDNMWTTWMLSTDRFVLLVWSCFSWFGSSSLF